MRLLNVHTLQLQEFFGHAVPPYMILSHRWSDDELTYKDFVKGRKKDSVGYRKILSFCKFVQRCEKVHLWRPTLTAEPTLLQWVWVDTICIDKSSSSELSEAINAMYEFYASSKCCCVYMRDVPAHSATQPDIFWPTFEASEWFRRGWTLQELLAPQNLIFCDSAWSVFGYLHSTREYSEFTFWDKQWSGDAVSVFIDRISRVTGI